jgi:hypothetical protein
MGELNTTRYVQRLKKPLVREGKAIQNPFAFGGGHKNGGLSDEATDLLSSLFSFDYMGSAEFEFGKLPETLQGMHENKEKLSSWELDINGTTIYVLAPEEHKEGVNGVIKDISESKLRLKEYAGLDEACGFNDRYKKEDCQFTGWLELDNGFMFFVDKTPFDGVCKIFEVESQ